ncbi:MAG: hypothetical protein AABW60_05370 [Thermoproteota archaeon]
MVEKSFDPEILYTKIVHYYVDKGHTKEQANNIAQAIIRREAKRRICKNVNCKHSSNEHIRQSQTCLVLDCSCTSFVK